MLARMLLLSRARPQNGGSRRFQLVLGARTFIVTTTGVPAFTSVRLVRSPAWY